MKIPHSENFTVALNVRNSSTSARAAARSPRDRWQAAAPVSRWAGDLQSTCWRWRREWR